MDLLSVGVCLLRDSAREGEKGRGWGEMLRPVVI